MTGQGGEPEHVTPEDTGSATIKVAAETATVTKRVVDTGITRVRVTPVEHDQDVTALLERTDVSVERVPVERVVSELPVPRQDGDTWIVPVLEERLVIEKQLVLVEELRIRTTTRTEEVSQRVRLKREHVEIETEKPRRPEKLEGDTP